MPGDPGLAASRCHDRLSNVSERTVDDEDGFPGWVIGVGLGLLLLVLLYFSFMPGMDHSGASQADATRDGYETLSVAAFAEELSSPDAFVVNVHVPDDGEIAGTDVRIPYDEIADSSRLPEDLDTRILLYCRTGSMSADAAASLDAIGYRAVAHLDGGMDAWADEGRPLRDTD